MKSKVEDEMILKWTFSRDEEVRTELFSFLLKGRDAETCNAHVDLKIKKLEGFVDSCAGEESIFQSYKIWYGWIYDVMGITSELR